MAKERELTVLERLKKLDAERAELVESAYGTALEEARNAVEQLNALGRGKFRLVEEGALPEPKPTKPRSGKGISTLPPRYVNKETGETWSGKGRPAGWLADIEAKGGKRVEYENPDYLRAKNGA